MKFRIYIKSIIASVAFMILAFMPLVSVSALAPRDAVCDGVLTAGGSCDEASAGTTVNDVVGVVVNVLSVLVGIVSVIMIIIGGYKYITSSGDTGSIKSAKDTILYAIVGLIIVAMAQVITGFVLSNV